MSSGITFRHVDLQAPPGDRRGEDGRRAYILRDLNLEIPPRTICTILGPSGAGKSTLLRLINRLQDPTAGEIFLDKQPLTSFNPTLLRRRVGYIFQVPTMLPGTVRDNLAYAVHLGQESARAAAPDPEAMAMRLREVALNESFLERPADRLSVGEQQRVSIARALMTRPEVLLMDEPTSALDPTATARLLELVRDLHAEEDLTIVFVTHLLEQARRIGNQTAIVIEGALVEVGPTGEVFDAPKSPETRRFLEAG